MQSAGSPLIQLIIFVLLVSFCACEGVEKPTPEAAQRFLKLRGYEFDEQSFFKAAAAGDALAVNGFLTAGINPNARDENGDTALTASAARGDQQMVNTLLSGGADINAKGRNNWTAFLLALEDERDDVAQALVGQPNLDLTAETPKGMTALMLAVWHQREALVRKLLELRADVNHQDEDGDSSVHGAAWFGNARILDELLEAGANPNLKNKLGGTALMWAASYGQDEAVQTLLRRGADPRIKDNGGVTAAGWAAKNGRGNLALMLRQAETKGSR
jgi:ankyrin repeat protein